LESEAGRAPAFFWPLGRGPIPPRNVRLIAASNTPDRRHIQHPPAPPRATYPPRSPNVSRNAKPPLQPPQRPNRCRRVAAAWSNSAGAPSSPGMLNTTSSRVLHHVAPVFHSAIRPEAHRSPSPMAPIRRCDSTANPATIRAHRTSGPAQSLWGQMPGGVPPPRSHAQQTASRRTPGRPDRHSPEAARRRRPCRPRT